MEALTDRIHWIPEDDILLKNAVEAGASLESLAKGAVKFSRKFTVGQLQDRWRSLLYDVDTSTDAAAKILEIEMKQAASNFSKPYQASKPTSKNNKANSVRSHYYAMRKRIRLAPRSFELGDRLKEESVQVDNFKEAVAEANNFMSDCCYQNGHNNGLPGEDGCLNGYSEKISRPSVPLDAIQCDDGNPLFEENLQQNEFPHLLGENLISVEDTTNDSDIRSPSKNKLKISNLNSHDLRCSFSHPEVPLLNMEIKNVHKTNASLVPKLDDNDINNVDGMDTAGFSDPLMMSEHDIVNLSTVGTSVNDLILLNEESDNNDKLDFGLNSTLLGSPVKTHYDLPNLIEPIVANIVDTGLEITEECIHVFCYQMDANLKSSFDIDIPSISTTQTTNSALKSEIKDCCTLNSQDPEVPEIDLAILPPKAYFSLSHSSRSKRLKREHLGSFFFGNKKDSYGDLGKGKKRIADVQHKVSNLKSNSTEARTSKTVGEPTQVDALKEKNHENIDALKEKNHENIDAFGSYLENMLRDVDKFKVNALRATYQEEANMQIMLHRETATSDQDKFCESEDDVPYTSDVEDMILRMDLSQYDEESYPYAKEVSSYQQMDTKKTIRLEQSLHSHINRSIASNGAFAVFYGRHLKYFIKNIQVAIGRETEDNQVDIDLQREGRANRVSRRQATIQMDKEGDFSICNLGRASIFVNGKEVIPKRCTKLPSKSLIRIHGLLFSFDVYESAVRRYIISKHQRRNQGKSADKFDWKLDQNP